MSLSSFPTFEVPLINLATLPSRPSINAAKIIAIIARSNCPLKENLIEVSPMQTPISVNIFGKIILAFFFSEITSQIIFWLFHNYFLASNVSPEIAF